MIDEEEEEATEFGEEVIEPAVAGIRLELAICAFFSTL